MRAFHYKILVCGQQSFRTIHETMPQLAWEAGQQRGFLLDKDNTAHRIAGRYIYVKAGKQNVLDPDTLQTKESPTESLCECRFEIDQQKALVMAQARRGELVPLFEALDSMPSVSIDFNDLNLNLTAMLFDLQRAYKKNDVKSLRIKDYLARENMLASATFKLIEPQQAEKLAERFADQLQAFTLSLKLPEGACAITVTKNGSVRASDDAPEDLLRYVKDLLPAHHEAEVETTEVRNPVAARRKRK
jgi:hypothetical protein